MLEKCVISQDPEYTEVFEILEWSKEAFLIKVRKYHALVKTFKNIRIITCIVDNTLILKS